MVLIPENLLGIIIMDDYELVPGLSTGNIRIGSRKLS